MQGMVRDQDQTVVMAQTHPQLFLDTLPSHPTPNPPTPNTQEAYVDGSKTGTMV